MNLNSEMEQAVADVGTRHIHHLLDLGVPRKNLALLGAQQAPFGVAMIKWNNEGIWWPDDNGVPRLLIPCYERGEIVDIVALKAAEPDVWFHRTGQAVILGADRLATCVKLGTLDVVSTPMDWLANPFKVVCVLNWAAAYHELSPLRDWPELRVDTVRLARAVGLYLERRHPIPKITLNLKEALRDAA